MDNTNQQSYKIKIPEGFHSSEKRQRETSFFSQWNHHNSSRTLSHSLFHSIRPTIQSHSCHQ